MLKALRHLAANGIAHRDVRPENILYEEDGNGDVILKLADFGLRIETNTAGPQLDIDPYRAPEARGRETQTHASDVWSLFATLSELANQFESASYHTYQEAWSKLHTIATEEPARGKLDLRDLREAIIWDANHRATAVQLIAKLFHNPEATKQTDIVPELMTWKTWTAQVGGEAAVKALYHSLKHKHKHPRKVVRDSKRSAPSGNKNHSQRIAPVGRGKKGLQAQKVTPSSAGVGGVYSEKERGIVEEDMRKTIKAEIKRVIVGEMRQCPDPRIKATLAAELKALLHSPVDALNRDIPTAACAKKLKNALAARAAVEAQLKGLQEELQHKSDVISELEAAKEAAPSSSIIVTKEDPEEALKTSEVYKNHMEEVAKQRHTDLRRVRQATEAKEFCEEQLKQTAEAKELCEEQLKQAAEAKEFCEEQLSQAAEARGLIESRLDEALASHDHLTVRIRELEDTLQLRDVTIAELKVAAMLLQDTAQETNLEDMEARLKDAIEGREHSEAQMREAIEARTGLEEKLETALTSRDQLKEQLGDLEARKATLSPREANQAADYKDAAVMVDIGTSRDSREVVEDQIKRVLDEKEAVDLHVNKVAMDRLAAEAKLKDAVAARRSAEDQIRKACAAREALESKLTRVRGERDALRPETTESKETRFSYRMDPLVKERHKHFVCPTNSHTTRSRVLFGQDHEDGEDGDHSQAKRRKINSEFGGPSTRMREQHFNDFASSSSGNARVRILC
ncbi:putative EKC/KEOPS complex subunit BUD32 [Seiridium cardinale]|uniref:EKC/KEOPS complex subunit BUD32 n=1 Tax=Seiridium cardinale TaxID=138064 RepID=A0ABR2X839_9PEZI